VLEWVGSRFVWEKSGAIYIYININIQVHHVIHICIHRYCTSHSMPLCPPTYLWDDAALQELHHGVLVDALRWLQQQLADHAVLFCFVLFCFAFFGGVVGVVGVID
jgi:hypothetical protein